MWINFFYCMKNKYESSIYTRLVTSPLFRVTVFIYGKTLCYKNCSRQRKIRSWCMAHCDENRNSVLLTKKKIYSFQFKFIWNSLKNSKFSVSLILQFLIYLKNTFFFLQTGIFLTAALFFRIEGNVQLCLFKDRQ